MGRNLLLLFFAIMITSITDITAQTMEARKQHLATIAALEAKGDLANLENAINAGLDEGLTVNQVKEALSQLYAYTGFPRSLNALGVLQRVVADRARQGKATVTGPDADPLPADYDALKQGTEVQTRLSGRAFDYDFAPQTDYYLKAHLFGDIFARNTLTEAEREVVTVSAISALEGCEPQLTAHVRGARNMGVTDDELHAIPQVLARTVGELEGWRAGKAVATVFEEPFTQGRPTSGTWPRGEFNSAYAQYFIGNSYIASLDAEHGGPVNVTFEPACRNNWHIHHKAVQVLVCVEGRGWYQEWGKSPVELKPGVVIAIPEGVKHWHGAARGSWFQHVTYMTRVEDGSTTDWLEPVNDDVYNQLP